MSQYKIDAEIVLKAARGRWDEILNNLAPALRPALQVAPRHVGCPIHGGNDGFRFFKDFKDTGQCICNTCGAFSGINILMKVNGWNFYTALKAIADHLRVPDGIDPESRIETFDGKVIFLGQSELRTGGKCFCLRLRLGNGQTKNCWGKDLERASCETQLQIGDNARVSRLGTKKFTYKGKDCKKVLWSVLKLPSDAEVAEKANLLAKETLRREQSIENKWQRAAVLTSSAAVQNPIFKYLKDRAILPTSSRVLKNVRFSAAEPYFDDKGNVLGHFPCMLSAVRDSNGEIVTLHRTYLNQFGQKITFGPAKKLMLVPSGKTILGASISFGDLADDGILCVAEGIETALSVQVGTGFPCLSCVTAQGLSEVKIPDGTKVVLIFADRDNSQIGQNAAHKLRVRLRTEGIPSLIFLPGKDVVQVSDKGVDWNDVIRQLGAAGFPIRHGSPTQSIA